MCIDHDKNRRCNEHKRRGISVTDSVLILINRRGVGRWRRCMGWSCRWCRGGATSTRSAAERCSIVRRTDAVTEIPLRFDSVHRRF
eukprot:COSAG01_NODE_3666_length_5799_cov_5.810957_4_plen_86_part_00